MNHVYKILSFLQVLDKDQNLSITNLAVIICLVKMVIAPGTALVDAGALLISLLNYGHKRFESNKAIKSGKEVKDVAALKAELSSVQDKLKEFSAMHETVAKQSEETKKLLSASNVAKSFGQFKG